MGSFAQRGFKMKKSNELTKDALAKLIKENPTAALEYIWELRKTLKDCNARKNQALLACIAVKFWASSGESKGGNPYLKDFVTLALKALGES